MISRIVKIIPAKLLIKLWKKVPFPQWFRTFILVRSNSRFLGAVQGIVVNERNEILILKHTYRKKPWGIPSGWMEYESPLYSLEREVYEETGFKINSIKVLDALHTKNPHRIDLIIYAKYICGDFKSSPEITDYMF